MQRIQSIDIFRGFTIFMMVFVNDLAGVAHIPQWMKHMPADADAMTFVDVVFPAFLFIVGMSIPLAIRAREEKGQSNFEIIKHIAIRTTGLLILGFFMVNGEEMNQEANLIPGRLWSFLLYLAAILIWNQYPRSEGRKNYLWWGLQILGFGLLIVLWVTFRKGEIGETGMTPSWWGILGLIGWAYLISVIAYFLFRENMVALAAIVAVFTMIVLGLKSPDMQLPWLLGWLKGEASHFSHASLTVMGMVSGVLFTKYSPVVESKQKIRWLLTMALMFCIAGYFLRPLYGISKIHATSTWALYSGAICCVVFPFIYWLVDIKGISRWANFLEPAGKNPLLTYILPSIFYAIVGYGWLPASLNSGVIGFVKAILFSLFILGIAAIMTRWKIRLQL